MHVYTARTPAARTFTLRSTTTVYLVVYLPHVTTRCCVTDAFYAGCVADTPAAVPARVPLRYVTVHHAWCVYTTTTCTVGFLYTRLLFFSATARYRSRFLRILRSHGLLLRGLPHWIAHAALARLRIYRVRTRFTWITHCLLVTPFELFCYALRMRISSLPRTFAFLPAAQLVLRSFCGFCVRSTYCSFPDRAFTFCRTLRTHTFTWFTLHLQFLDSYAFSAPRSSAGCVRTTTPHTAPPRLRIFVSAGPAFLDFTHWFTTLLPYAPHVLTTFTLVIYTPTTPHFLRWIFTAVPHTFTHRYAPAVRYAHHCYDYRDLIVHPR